MNSLVIEREPIKLDHRVKIVEVVITQTKRELEITKKMMMISTTLE